MALIGDGMGSLRVGTAGWSVPRAVAEHFPAAGSALERYAARFDAVEINSTFYRSHRSQTYERWRDSVPPGFRFAVKAPRAITHDARLIGCDDALAAFVAEAGQLGDKLGPLLVQLPPSLRFDAAAAGRFFARLRALSAAPVVCEPRHASWFEPEPDALLAAHRIARAAVDPAGHRLAATPGGWRDLAYWRLHGSPQMYYSAYGEQVVGQVHRDIRSHQATEAWCIFDNTAAGAAAADALTLRALSQG
jgi:uncharacterized protein YecE (DUF72 family)